MRRKLSLEGFAYRMIRSAKTVEKRSTAKSALFEAKASEPQGSSTISGNSSLPPTWMAKPVAAWGRKVPLDGFDGLAKCRVLKCSANSAPSPWAVTA
jgi:hypothetical protein